VSFAAFAIFAAAASATPVTVATAVVGGSAGDPTLAVVNDTLHDTATLSGTNAGIATGTVTYKVYDNDSCTTNGATLDLTPSPNTVTGGVVPASLTHKFTNSGLVYFVASYTSGDANNSSASSACDAEPVFVQGVAYGVSSAKGCQTPTFVGQKVFCFYTFTNVTATGPGNVPSKDTVTLNSASDMVFNAGGPTNSGEILPLLHLVFSPATGPGAPTCVGGSGAGTTASPYLGATQCTVPYAGSISTAPGFDFGWYTSTAADFALDPVNHKLTDQLTFLWQDLCDKTPSPDTCSGQTVNKIQQPASTTLVQYKPTINTVIVPAGPITIGTTAHDTATITFDHTPPVVSGTVTYILYSHNDCTNQVQDLTPVSNGYTGGAVPNSKDFQFNTAGTFYFVATFSGDAAHGVAGPVNSGCAAEPLVVQPAAPTLSTQASPATTVPATLTDTATLSGGTSPTGTITFHLYSDAGCSTEVAGSPVTKTVSGNGPYTSPGIAVNAAATYFWRDSYSGDANNLPAPNSGSPNFLPTLTACGATNESTVVSPVTPTLLTAASAPVQIPVTGGVTLTDTATLSGGVSPTGTITFHLYLGAGCTTEVSGSPVTKTVSGNGPYTSPGITVNTAGTYFWRDSYSGDGNNNPVALTACGAQGESTLVSPRTPTVNTVIVPAGPLSVGSTAHDTATLTGATSNAGGSVTYALYSDNGCTTLVQDLTPTPPANNVVGGSVPNSKDFTFNNVGTFYFVATYTGDVNNTGPVSSGCAAEPLVIQPKTPSLSTQASAPVQIPVTGGVSLTDTATLSGATSNAGGTITFHLYSDAGCASEVSGSPVTKTVSGNGPYTSPGITVNNAGTYFWRDSYSGDANNNPVPLTACGATNESTVVSPRTPSVNTVIVPAGPLTLGQSAHDTATLTGATSNAGGTVTYALYSNNNCTTLVADLTPASNTVTNGNLPNSKDFTFNAAGTFYFVATYSGDVNNTGPVSSGCAAEQILVGKAQPKVNTVIVPPGPLNIGQSAHDTATLTGATASPTGTVTYALYSDNACTTLVANLTPSPNAVTSATLPNSKDFTFVNAGTFYFVATYSGDANNQGPVSSGCAAEPIVINKGQPSLTTTATPQAAHLPADLADTAHFTGATANATGTITFHLYSDVPCNVQVGTVTKAVNGNGDYLSPTIHVNGPIGAYNWRAEYSGDANNLPIPLTPCGAPGEEVAIDQAQPALTTQASPASSIPANLTDTANLTGATTTAGGTITFHLFSNATCTAEVSGSPVTAAVNGNGFYTSPAIKVNAAGTYFWRDSYSGDANNAPVPLTACGAPGESTSVNAGGSLELCKDGSGGAAGQVFKFSGTNLTNGATFGPISVTGGTCNSAMTVAAGRWQIFEDLSSGLWSVSEIDVVPPANFISQSLLAGWVKVIVQANAPETQVTFFNQPQPGTLKICKFSSTPAIQGNQFSFTVGTKTLTAIAGTTKATAGCSGAITVQPGSVFTVKENVPANEQVTGIFASSNAQLTNKGGGVASVTVGPGANVITYDNEPVGPAQNGFVEICKDAGDQFISLTTPVNFSVTDKTGAVVNPSVIPGQCSGPIQVAAGNVDIAETIPNGQAVTSISAIPQSALGPNNKVNGTATVVVPVSSTSTNEVQVHFQNSTVTSQLKICKVLSSSSGDLANQTFTFDWKDNTTGATGTVTVRAVVGSAGNCVIVTVPFPTGDSVTVTERPQTYVGAEGGSPNAGATKTITIGSGINSVSFNNQAFGQVEVCKDVDNPQFNGVVFTFKISGVSGNTQVAAGACSQPILVPVGQVTITETAQTGFAVSGVTATGNFGDNRLVSQSGNAATVSVPFFNNAGSAGGETDVHFLNTTQSATIKICKVIESGSAGTSIANQPYTFKIADVTGGLPGTVLTAALPVAPPYPGPASCSTYGPINVVKSDGTTKTKLRITENTAPNASPSVIDVNGPANVNNTNNGGVTLTLTGPGVVVVTVQNTFVPNP
jgi:hypothetical protein